MAHYDQETLALLAMGESGEATDHGAHLTTCDQCRHDVGQLAAVIVTARQVTAQDQPQAPPDAVWQRILSGIASEPSAASQTSGAAETSDASETGGAAETARVKGAPADVISIRSRRPHPALLAAAAALVGILIGVGATYAATRNPSSPPVAATQIALQPLDAPAAHGTAALDESAGGQRTLTVTVNGLPSVPGTFYEVWLMNATPQRLLSLGVLDSSHGGVFQIPAGLDLSRYPVVDISLQPFNGSPAHSGNSAVRGTLPA